MLQKKEIIYRHILERHFQAKQSAFTQLELSLVHNASLLSRRVRKLAATKPPLLEI